MFYELYQVMKIHQPQEYKHTINQEKKGEGEMRFEEN